MNLITQVAVFITGLSFWYYPVIDPDLGWHLFGGAYISEHGFPQSDPINSFNTFWFDYHWLAQILMFKVYQFGGYELLRFFFGIIIGLQLVIILECAGIITKNKISTVNSLLVVLFYLFFISTVSSIRPQTIAMLLICYAFRELLQSSKYELIKLSVISILLVNIHIYWVIIPFLWFMLRIIPAYLKQNEHSFLYLAGGLAMLSSAGFISPYGLFAPQLVPSIPFGIFGNYVLLFEYIFSPSQFSELIVEFRGGMSRMDACFFCLLSLIIIFTASLLKANGDSRKDLAYKILGIIGVMLAVKSVKFVNLASVFCIPWLVLALPPVSINTQIEKTALWFLILFESAAATLINPWSYSNLSLLKEKLPVDLCAKLDTYGANAERGNHVRVLTHFDHGGWCRWSLYQKNPSADYRVTTDGRTQFIDPAFFIEGLDLYKLKNNWLRTLETWKPDIIVSEVNWPLAQFLYYSKEPKEWRLAERDNMFAVFVRDRK